jgi:hypothetical protein
VRAVTHDSFAVALLDRCEKTRMEAPMIDWQHLPDTLTPEDRRLRARWACAVGAVYLAALVLLIAAATAQHMLTGPTPDTTVATAPAKAGVGVR